MITYLVAWYLTGVVSFIYWWTTKYNLEVRDLVMTLMMGVFGPIVFIIGFSTDETLKEKVLIKKRK
jgi:TctA family transporter